MCATPAETASQLVRRLTSGELDSLRDDVAAGRREVGLKALDERGAASDIVRDQYTGRYPLELIQNANDAAASDGSTGRRAKFVLTQSALLVADEGAGFGTEQVRAICGLARSSKDPRKTIGYKGLGFKSVREITDAPQVISGDLMFCFDAARLRREVESILGEELPEGSRLPDYAFPFEITMDDLEDDRGAVEALRGEGFRTIMRLPFRSGDDRQVVEEHLIESVVPRLLLFLDATESLELAGTPADFTALAVREQRIGHQELLLEAGDKTEHLLIFKREVAVEDRTLVSALGGAWGQVEAVRLAVAVPLGSNGVPVGGASEPLHVYFPTEEQTGVSLILNADFQVELDRRRISRTVQADPYNRWLRDELAEFVAWTVVPSLAERFDGIGVLEVLASYGDESGWGEEVIQQVIVAVATQEIVPCRDLKFRSPSESRLLPANVPDVATLDRWLVEQPAVVVPAAEMSAAVRELLKVRLRVPELPIGPVLATLDPGAESDWDGFYNFIVEWSSRAPRGFDLLLASARCVRLSNGEWVRPSDGVVFLPPQRSDREYPFELQLPIAQLSEIDGLAKLLEGAGVEPLTWRALVADFLVPRLSDPHGEKSERELALRALRTYYETVRRGDTGDQEIREAVPATLLPACSVGGAPVSLAPAGRLYFGDKWSGASGLETLYGPFGEPDFLAVDPSDDAASEFEFYRWLGVADRPRLVEVDGWTYAYPAWRNSTDYRRASVCLTTVHPNSQSLTSKPSLDRLPELLASGDPVRLAVLWKILGARWAEYRTRLSQATFRCIASAAHSVDRDRSFISPGLFLLRAEAWIPAVVGRADSLAKPGDLWRSIQGMPREVGRMLSVPASSLGRVPADFAEDLGLLDISAASSADLVNLLVDMEISEIPGGGTTFPLESAQWVLRQLEQSEWLIPLEPGSVPLIARRAGQSVFERRPVIANNPTLAEVWGDALPIYAGDHDLYRLLGALGVQFLDDLVQVEPMVGRREPELEDETLAHLTEVAPALIALASREVPSRRLGIAQRLKSLTVICAGEIRLRYLLEGYGSRADDAATAYIDCDGVLYLKTDGIGPDWSSLALRLADYLEVDSGDGFAFVLTTTGATREGFLRAHQISDDALENAAQAFDETPRPDDNESMQDEPDFGISSVDEPSLEGTGVHSDGASPAVAIDFTGHPAGSYSGGDGAEAGLAPNAPDRATTPDIGAASGARGRDFSSDVPPEADSSGGHTGAHSSGSGRSLESGLTGGASATRRNTSGAGGEDNESRFYSYLAVHGSDEGRIAQRHESEAMRIGSLGVDHVIAYEATFGRTAVAQHHSNKGFDLVSTQPNGADRRVIEVKATSQAWPARGIPVSKHQIDKNAEAGEGFWLYVVEYATDPGKAKVIPIQNPVASVDYFVFDRGWDGSASRSEGQI